MLKTKIILLSLAVVSLNAPSDVRVQIQDILGRIVKTSADGLQRPGQTRAPERYEQRRGKSFTGSAGATANLQRNVSLTAYRDGTRVVLVAQNSGTSAVTQTFAIPNGAATASTPLCRQAPRTAFRKEP